MKLSIEKLRALRAFGERARTNGWTEFGTEVVDLVDGYRDAEVRAGGWPCESCGSALNRHSTAIGGITTSVGILTSHTYRPLELTEPVAHT